MAMVVALACELARRGHEVDVVCTDRPSGSAHEAQWISRLAESGVMVRFLGRTLGSPGLLPAMKLWRLIQSKRYDVVHSHLPMPDAMCGLARRLSVPRFAHVVTVHNSLEPRSWPLTLLARGGNVAYCSQVARERNPLAGQISMVIPNGIPQKPYSEQSLSKQQIRERLGIPADAMVMIAVGRMCPQKDFDTALETLQFLESHKMFPRLQCLFCGDGDDKVRLEVRAHQMGLDQVVRFMGTRTDIPELLKASDIFLSTSRYEGMPLTVLEALTAGLTCVLSDIEEHREIADSAPGCYFVPHVAEAIGFAVQDAVRDMPNAKLLRQIRGSLLQKHSVTSCVDSYEALYQSCSRSASVVRQSASQRGANVAN
jgi:glycosyltransferase involved in cell wall biosynthesis